MKVTFLPSHSSIAEDGATRAKGAAFGPLEANDNDLLIGKYNNTLNGIIDEVVIYNRVLTEE